MIYIYRTGNKWRQGKSKLNKQVTTVNINSYCAGFNVVADRFVRNVIETQDDQGWVNNVRELLIHWSFECKDS